MKKITFFGDIMCEPPVLKGGKRPSGKYDFDPVFDDVKNLFAESDYVVGNLETPLAGKDAGYTDEYYIFNAPDEFADAAKNAGIDLILTANNHSFDRNYEGLVRTLQVLDEKNIPHTGTWAKGEDREEAYYFTLNGTKFAVISYTYGTNTKEGRPTAVGELEGTVNLLRPPQGSAFLDGIRPEKTWIQKLLVKKKYGTKYSELAGRINQFFGLPGNWIRKDDRLDKAAAAPYFEKMQADIRDAKKKADLVIFAPHIGGQFNNEPGEFSKYTVKKALEAGADAIMASHSHCPQQIEHCGDVPCAWSLGNFNMDPTSSLAMPSTLSHFGLAAHLYVEDGKIVKTTFSMLKALHRRGKQIRVVPADELYPTLSAKKQQILVREVRKLYTIVTKTSLAEPYIRREYDIPQL